NRGEVHRRCGDGGVGNARSDRGRRGAGGAGRARSRGCGVLAGGRGGRIRAARSRRRVDRRGGGDSRCRGGGDGRGRPRQPRGADERKGDGVGVTGIGGIGKSRRAWECYKYFDGIVERVWWHRGRCLAYGEGVTYWALAEMVRSRCRIAEDEDSPAAFAKLRTM